MVNMPNRALGGVVNIPPIAPFADPLQILEANLSLLDPPSRIGVTDAAERYIRLSLRGVTRPFDRGVAPYMVEPADATQSRRFRGVVFVGPSQSAKTTMLIAVAMHSVMCDPAPVSVIHMDQRSRDKWVREDLNPVIHGSPLIRDELGGSREDDTLSRKQFRGMNLYLGYPTPQEFSASKRQKMLMTDYDHFPPELGMTKDEPEGTPFDLALQRAKTFGSRGCVLAESSPAYAVTDPAWSPTAAEPHMLPPVPHGIVPLYNRGTRGRLYWECPDCSELFEPRFDRLRFDAKLPPRAAGEGAEMECPHCQARIAERHKVDLNRGVLDGRGGWLHEADDGSLVSLYDTRVRGSEIASFALNGAAAAFSRWPQLVMRFLEAIEDLKQDNDPKKLRSFNFTEVGMPYVAPVQDDGSALQPERLKADRPDTPRGTAPDWVRVITVSVDVQRTYFAVQVTGWGVDGTGTVIDRLDLTEPPHDPETGEVEKRVLDPARRPEDWSVLDRFEDMVWPVMGKEFGLRAMALSVDFQGDPGVSDNAEAFWFRRKRAGAGPRWFVTRGQGGWRISDRVWLAAPERSNQKRRRGRGFKLLSIATDKLKDSVTGALQREPGSAGAFILPAWLSDGPVAEFCAEERGDKGWKLKRGQKRNESLDLTVYGRALIEHKGLRRINPEAPPAWCVLGEGNPWAVTGNAAPRPEPPSEPKAKAQADAPYIDIKGDWIS